ncbi:DUF4197 domain-containing protein [Portibacter marinus]|uniref:DUF4197 domain-containing protein n=1 Tax=Portibacter marinus TaxID=2898660 RepID=UPI001F403C04|nr:DUF4197 domain-containing protein [Portibacter marinus]
MRLSFLLLAILTFTISNAQINLGGLIDKGKKVLEGENPLSKDEIAAGLKQALDKGIDEAVTRLSAEDGYLASTYKIEVPEEAQKVISKLKLVPGFENVEQELILRMNRAAEVAAKKATPIFVDAVRSISFDDAMNILKGEDDAATDYLSAKSRKKLYDEFMPVIVSALDEVNARSYWKSATDAYNKLPFVKKVNPELDDHVNTKALDGLFGLIAVKEKGIRNNIDQRSTDLLRKVFAQQD